MKPWFDRASQFEDTFAFMVNTIRPSWIIVFFLLLNLPLLAQEKQSVQIKTFDQKLQVLRNIEVSLNDREFVSVGSKGSVVVELNASDLPIKSIKIKDEKLEAASWNFSKGIVEIIVRPKNYSMIHLAARFPNGNPLSQSTIIFKGSKPITVTTNSSGEFDLPIPLNERVASSDQFQVDGLRVVRLTLAEAGNVLLVDRPKPIDISEKTASTKEQLGNFNLSRLDSIQSLTVFYSVFKDASFKSFDEATRARIDAKFNQLLLQRQDSVSQNQSNFISRISDSSIVSEDLRNLLNQATLESNVLQSNRSDFESKIKVISDKLEKGITNLSQEERKNVLSDLDLLEKMLVQNESKFYQNQNDYREIISTLKQKYFDIQNLETRLSQAEKEREEEQRVFRQQLVGGGVILVTFGVLIILLISFSGRLRKQANDLRAANEEVKSINENLEAIVVKRTKLLEESNKELDTFLYRASHDLRSPIRSILGLCSIIDHVPQSELVHRMKGTSMGMDRMLKKLIKVSEISREALNHEKVSVLEVILEVEHKQAKFIKDNNIQFDIECSDTIVMYTSRGLLEGILTELIENAVFFSALKNTSYPQVEVKVSLKGKNLELCISDNGIGIEELVRPRIFDMFFMGHELSRGNGLGLYTVQKCVQALHGKIIVESEVGRYALFRIVLPHS